MKRKSKGAFMRWWMSAYVDSFNPGEWKRTTQDTFGFFETGGQTEFDF
ncbi:MAG: hypothetical protein ABIS50_22465 [Luteolibacter sp.]